MPNEPKNNAEAMLKAYSERRRAEAGPPIEPHPATRQLLQDEIARTFSAPPEQGPSWRAFLLGMIPRLAIAGGITAALALAVYLVHREKSSAYTMAMNEPVAAGAPSTRSFKRVNEMDSKDRETSLRDEKSRDLATDNFARKDSDKPAIAGAPPQAFGGAAKDATVLEETAHKKLELADAGVDRAKSLAPSPVAAPSLEAESKKSMAGPAIATAESQPPAKTPVEPAQKLGDAETKLAIVPARALPSTAAPAPTAPASSAATLADTATQNSQLNKAAEPKVKSSLAFNEKAAAVGQSAPAASPAPAPQGAQNSYLAEQTGEMRQNFSQVIQRSQYRLNFNSPKPSPVLNNFQVERAGNRVQVTDADGSIYLGTVMPADQSAAGTQANQRTSGVQPLKTQAAPTPNSRREVVAAEAKVAAPDSGQANFAFQVTGTNRTVKKVVVFNGSLNIDPALDAVAQQTIQLRNTGQAVDQSQNNANAMQNSQNHFITNQAGLIQNGRLRGQAVVGGREKLPIDAVPAAP